MGLTARDGLRKLDPESLKKALADPVLRVLLQASILVANEDGQTIRVIAETFGVSKSSIHRYIQEARDRRNRNIRARLIYAPCAVNGCIHKAIIGPGLVICLDCGKISPELEKALARDRRPIPKREPSRVYRPGKLKGGK